MVLRVWFALAAFVVAIAGLPASQRPVGGDTTPSPGGASPVVPVVPAIPAAFEANRGQLDPRVSFVSRGQGYALFLTPSEAVLTVRRPGKEGRRSAPGVARLRLVGSNPRSEIVGLDRLETTVNHIVGAEPPGWQVGVPTYERVTYRQVYPGIDLVWYWRSGRLEYDFVVGAGFDPGVIAVELGGTGPAAIDGRGRLVLPTAAGPVVQGAPVIHQQGTAGAKLSVRGRWALDDQGRARFRVGRYDRSRPLVIDPTIVASTTLGGAEADAARGVALDGEGNAYVTGDTLSADFPVKDPVQAPGSGADVFVAKLDRTGRRLIYATYLGGSHFDVGHGIAVDGTGAAYVAGETRSDDFPRVRPLQGARGPGFCGPRAGPCPDAFLVKLDSRGQLAYSTYLGGTGADVGLGIVVDGSGRATVTGSTGSGDFPTANPSQSRLAGPVDAFVASLDPGGTKLEFATFLGGAGGDQGRGVAVDGSGAIYVTGDTNSADFPTTPGAVQGRTAGSGDAFVARLDPVAAKLAYATYLGGSGAMAGTDGDSGRAIAVDPGGGAVVAGVTNSADFPTAAALQPRFGGGGTDAFVARLGPDGGLVQSTFLGGSGDDTAAGLALGQGGNAYLTGETSSSDFPTVQALLAPAGKRDAFVAEVKADGSALAWSTLLGGADDDSGTAIAVGGDADVVVVGETRSDPFPLKRPLPGAAQRGGEAFVVRFSSASPSAPRVAGVVPTRGILAGGTAVRIRGSGFLGTTEVRFGDQPAPNYRVLSDTAIAAATPPGTPGEAPLSVSGPGGASKPGPARFLYDPLLAAGPEDCGSFECGGLDVSPGGNPLATAPGGSSPSGPGRLWWPALAAAGLLVTVAVATQRQRRS